MTKEENEILLKDLCGRLPYGVIVEGLFAEMNYDTDEVEDVLEKKVLSVYDLEWFLHCAVELKPYLRPMSSMTYVEKSDYEFITERWMYDATYSISDSIDWLNEHHFDYRGLIEKGLALKATNDMYETKEE